MNSRIIIFFIVLWFFVNCKIQMPPNYIVPEVISLFFISLFFFIRFSSPVYPPGPSEPDSSGRACPNGFIRADGKVQVARHGFSCFNCLLWCLNNQLSTLNNQLWSLNKPLWCLNKLLRCLNSQFWYLNNLLSTLNNLLWSLNSPLWCLNKLLWSLNCLLST